MRLKARQQLTAFLLRRARRNPGKTSWTKSDERWIVDQRVDCEADRIALAEYQLAVQSAEQRVQRMMSAPARRQCAIQSNSRSGRCAAGTP